MADAREAHPHWAPAHNREERWQEVEAARLADRARRTREAQELALMRRHHISGEQARRFLDRQRASRKRYQEAQAQDAALQGQAVLLCCGTALPIVQMPLTCPACGHVWLAER